MFLDETFVQRIKLKYLDIVFIQTFFLVRDQQKNQNQK